MLECIRKFGLDYSDLPTMLWNVAVLLRVLTLDIDPRYTKGIPLIFYIFTAVLAICFYYEYLVSITWFVFVKCPETGDTVAAMIALSLGVASEIGTTKMIYLYLKKDLVKKLVVEFLEHDSSIDPKTRFAKNMRKTLRVVKRRAVLFWLALMVNGFIYCIKPIFLSGRHVLEDSFIVYGLEPTLTSPNYEIVYFMSVCGVFFACYLPANITGFFFLLTGYVEAQILALSIEITRMWEDANKHYKKKNINQLANGTANKNKIMNEYIKIKLAKFIKRHTINIDLLRQIEIIFTGSIAIEFTLLVIGLIAELLGGLENTFIEVPFTLVQVAMDCLIGQRVMDACVKLENAVYDSKWENFNTANRKTILLLLQNAQRTFTLSAGGITILSFTSLMSILKSVYSAYTTLRSTVNKK